MFGKIKDKLKSWITKSKEDIEETAPHSESKDSESQDEQSNQIINIAYIRTGHTEDDSTDFEMYLINDGPYHIYYNLDKRYKRMHPKT